MRLVSDDVDFDGRGLRWGDDKTKAGSRRTVPISQRAMSTLETWALNFPHRKPHHFVFPTERYRQPKSSERGKSCPYTPNPLKPITSIQRSWETALERAGWILAGRPELATYRNQISYGDIPPMKCRFHDLRHTACTRMIRAKTPIPIVAQLVGWSPTTMWQMAAKYGHFDQDDLRQAVETISGNGFERASPDDGGIKSGITFSAHKPHFNLTH